MKLDEALKQKLARVKALEGKTVMDIIASDDFQRIMSAFWSAQKEDYEDAVKLVNQQRAAGITSRIPGHPITSLAHLKASEMTAEYLDVIMGRCTRPSRERIYIRQIGEQVYRNTILEIAGREFPEVLEYLKPDASK